MTNDGTSTRSTDRNRTAARRSRVLRGAAALLIAAIAGALLPSGVANAESDTTSNRELHSAYLTAIGFEDAIDEAAHLGVLDLPSDAFLIELAKSYETSASGTEACLFGVCVDPPDVGAIIGAVGRFISDVTGFTRLILSAPQCLQQEPVSLVACLLFVGAELAVSVPTSGGGLIFAVVLAVVCPSGQGVACGNTPDPGAVGYALLMCIIGGGAPQFCGHTPSPQGTHAEAEPIAGGSAVLVDAGR